MELSDLQRLWVCDMIQAPPRMYSVLRHACCGDCDESNFECMLPVLRAIVVGTARRLCDHFADWRHPCAHCGLALLSLAERARGSAWWNGDSFVEEIQRSARLLARIPRFQNAARQLVETYDGETWPDEHIYATFGDGFFVTLAEADALVAECEDEAAAEQESPIATRVSDREPRRAAYTRAELEIARRKDWSEPQRFIAERVVRDLARNALTEAAFVRGSIAAPVTLYPLPAPSGCTIIGYAAESTTVGTEDRRTFSGQHMAPDLSLGILRAAWTAGEDGPGDAWATWMLACSAKPLLDAPADRRDGKWRWTLELDAGAADPDLPVTLPNRESVRRYLTWLQGGRCAMCSIRRYHWETLRGQPVPAELVGPAECLDHDHGTGLIRGLLCTPCNSRWEPRGQYTGDPVRAAYVADPPAALLRMAY